MKIILLTDERIRQEGRHGPLGAVRGHDTHPRAIDLRVDGAAAS